jgi:hypothetical protein
MAAVHLLLFFLCAWIGSGLLELKKEEIGIKYEIGTITDLFFNIKDKVFFKADREVFGFISPVNGSLLAVYELEPNEKILSYVTAGEIVIATDEKKLSSFISFESSYSKLSETEALERMGNYSKLIDFRRYYTNTYVLTDRYLMQVPFVKKPN